jgi:hypothetical protein
MRRSSKRRCSSTHDPIRKTPGRAERPATVCLIWVPPYQTSVRPPSPARIPSIRPASAPAWAAAILAVVSGFTVTGRPYGSAIVALEPLREGDHGGTSTELRASLRRTLCIMRR